MTVDLIKVIGEVGSLAVLVLVLYFVWRYGGQFVNRLMDNLDAQAKNSEATIEVQAGVAEAVRAVRDELLSQGVAQVERAEAQANCNEVQAESMDSIVQAFEENTAALGNVSRQIQSHETRAQKRHEQQLAHADERHGELIGVLRGWNGKPNLNS